MMGGGVRGVNLLGVEALESSVVLSVKIVLGMVAGCDLTGILHVM
jgi:hypothetical protein